VYALVHLGLIGRTYDEVDVAKADVAKALVNEALGLLERRVGSTEKRCALAILIAV